jgi:uncharacterized protein (TIGR00369 family)
VTWTDPADTAAGMVDRTGLEFLQAMAAGDVPSPPILASLDFVLDQVEFGRVRFSFEPQEFHYNPIGSVHGGVYATLLDSACGCAVHSMLPVGTGYTSLDLAVKFLGAARLGVGRLTCLGTVTHLGRRTALAEARITDPGGKLLATATSSCLLLGT